MRGKLTALLLCVTLFLTGCGKDNSGVEKAVALRNKLLQSNGCSFQAEITADYGEKIYKFSMACTGDKEGNVAFTVTAPESITGITGEIRAQSGEIVFDDQVLGFQTLADGQVAPVSAPWLLIKTLRSGYLRACTREDDDYQIVIDDSYGENALRLNIWVEQETPEECEIYWEGRRVLSMEIEEFTYL